MHHPVDTENLEDNLNHAVTVLRKAETVAVLTGAGVSAESGVATFRGAARRSDGGAQAKHLPDGGPQAFPQPHSGEDKGLGLWESYRIDEVATPEAFRKDPQLVWKFYNMRRNSMRTIQPNPGHHALARMEQIWSGGRFTLITQNIDGLHQLAGSKRVLEIHGNLARIRCTGCGKTADRGWEPLPDLPRCEDCSELLRPAVVWFHEMLPEDIWTEAAEKAVTSSCLLVVGTSAVVYPAAGLIGAAHEVGSAVIEVNLEPAGVRHPNTIGLYGPSGVILPELVRRLNPS